MIVAGVFMTLLGVSLAAMLAFASRRFYVFEDPRIGAVEDLLPKSNCGACGHAGCRDFAEKVAAGAVSPAHCTVSAPAQHRAIADLLGVATGSVDKRVARLACGGGRHVAFLRARYEGWRTCRAAAVVNGGGKECAWGCLGLGDCAAVCAFDAVRLDLHGLPWVDVERCTACGDCVDVCPKNLFSLEPLSRRLWVACQNQADGDTALAACEVACTACGKCVADAPGLIQLKNNLAVVDAAAAHPAPTLDTRQAEAAAIERCPTGAIVWFDQPDSPRRGAAARPVLRHEALPILHS